MVLERVIVTGASGMLGSCLAAHLKAAGHGFLAASRTKPGWLAPGDSWTKWDLTADTAPHDLAAMFPDATAIIHAGACTDASSDPASESASFDANVRSCHLLGLFARTRDIPLAFVSGATVYADPYAPSISEDAPETSGGLGGFYGYTKLLAEKVLAWHAYRGLRLLVARPSSLYGPGMKQDKLIPRFLAEAARGATIEVAQPASDAVNLIHAADLAAFLLEGLSRGACGVYNVAGPGTVTMEGLARACVEVAGKGSVRIAPGDAGRSSTRFQLDDAKARRDVGYLPRVSLEQGLKDMLARMEEAPA